MKKGILKTSGDTTILLIGWTSLLVQTWALATFSIPMHVLETWSRWLSSFQWFDNLDMAQLGKMLNTAPCVVKFFLLALPAYVFVVIAKNMIYEILSGELEGKVRLPALLLIDDLVLWIVSGSSLIGIIATVLLAFTLGLVKCGTSGDMSGQSFLEGFTSLGWGIAKLTVCPVLLILDRLKLRY